MTERAHTHIVISFKRQTKEKNEKEQNSLAPLAFIGEYFQLSRLRLIWRDPHKL